MKSVRFLGDSLKRLRESPEDARQDAGYQLDKLQRRLQPDDFKPMPSIGRSGRDSRVGRVGPVPGHLYGAPARNGGVLHAFQKKPRATRRQDIEPAKRRWAKLVKEQ